MPFSAVPIAIGRIQNADEIPSLVLLAYTKLREAILSGAISPGAVLRQQKVAADLGISRLPVREALSRLESEGLVVLRARRGYVVASVDIDEVIDVFDTRVILEQRAGFLAAERRTEDDVVRLQAVLDRLSDLPISSENAANSFALWNREFHDALFAPCGRRHLLSALKNLRDKAELFIKAGALMTGHVRHVAKEHGEIFNAFRSGDAKATADLCGEHVRAAGERLVKHLRESAEKDEDAEGSRDT